MVLQEDISFIKKELAEIRSYLYEEQLELSPETLQIIARSQQKDKSQLITHDAVINEFLK